MGEPLFYLGLEFRDELSQDGPTGALREAFKRRGCPLSQDAFVQTVGAEYLIIDGNPDHGSYTVKQEGEKLAAYAAFVRLGTPDDFLALSAEELYAGLGGAYAIVHLEHCAIRDAVNISGAGSPQNPEGVYLLDKELVCRNCEFTGLADFSNTSFQRGVDLRGAAFRKGGEFRGATFQDNSNFDLATFQEFAHFARASFKKGTHFSGATFQGDALFYRAIFQGQAGFSRADFQSHADFSEAVFRGGAVCAESVFHAGADFSRAQFVGRADFRGAQCGKPIEFTDVRYWPNTIGHWWRRKLLNEWTRGLAWRTDKPEEPTEEPTETPTEEQPRWLTRKLLPLDEYPDGPPQEATVFFVESEYISEVSNPLFKRYVADMLFIRAFRAEYPFVAWLWQWSADYGRSLLVWGFWSAMVVLFFALWYTPASASVPLVEWQLPAWWQEFWLARGPRFQQTASAYVDEPLNFWSAIYFSVVTFTTLGFGDISTANGAARAVTTAEVILGYIMLGGLISILAHKLARRS